MAEMNDQASTVFGPYTPQETDRIATALKAKNIPFEIHKDADDEKKFTRTDFQSVVTRAEYRTETYLAQIFYFTVATAKQNSFQEILQSLNLGPQEFGGEPANLNTALPPEEENEIVAGSRSKNLQKRYVAQFLAFTMIAGILLMAFQFFANR